MHFELCTLEKSFSLDGIVSKKSKESVNSIRKTAVAERHYLYVFLSN
jgi:hypothetical protein